MCVSGARWNESNVKKLESRKHNKKKFIDERERKITRNNKARITEHDKR